jgi:hypothetical protein
MIVAFGHDIIQKLGVVEKFFPIRFFSTRAFLWSPTPKDGNL